jgi:hypothetical protein
MSLANELSASKKIAPAILPVAVRQSICTLTGAAQPVVPSTAVIVNSSSVEQVGILSYFVAGTPANNGSTPTSISFTPGGDGSEVLYCLGSANAAPNGCVLTKVAPNTSALVGVSYGTGADLTGATLVVLWTPITPIA